MKEGRKPEYPEKTPGDELQNPVYVIMTMLSMDLTSTQHRQFSRFSSTQQLMTSTSNCGDAWCNG